VNVATFYATPFGHIEVRIDRRDPRPAHLAQTTLRRPSLRRRIWSKR
jgi:hypothetical protein